mgnify:CR=1 FL=1
MRATCFRCVRVNILSGTIIVMYGLVDDVYLCNLDRTTELSNRMAARNVPSETLQPSFGIRPVSTKYAMMPILDRRAPATVPIKKEPVYNVSQVFNPGSAEAPWSGFASNVDVESDLRSQFFALQKCEQSEYVPSTASDMYMVKVQSSSQVQQPFPGLFTREPLAPRSHTGETVYSGEYNDGKTHSREKLALADEHIGKSVFSNHTRQQRMDGKCIHNKL